MAYIYAMSDIHGEIEAFERALEVIDLSDSDSRLILAGDFIDHQFRKIETYDLIMRLQDTYPDQVIALKGNIDVAFAEQAKASTDADTKIIIKWISKLPLIYVTDTQVFVHAGIDEEAGDLWECGTDEFTFYGKYPPTTGSFALDVIAGHVGTSSQYLSNNQNFHNVFWDGSSHYFIDGSSEISHFIPILKYDTGHKTYSCFQMNENTELLEEIPLVAYDVLGQES